MPETQLVSLNIVHFALTNIAASRYFSKLNQKFAYKLRGFKKGNIFFLFKILTKNLKTTKFFFYP